MEPFSRPEAPTRATILPIAQGNRHMCARRTRGTASSSVLRLRNHLLCSVFLARHGQVPLTANPKMCVLLLRRSASARRGAQKDKGERLDLTRLGAIDSPMDALTLFGLASVTAMLTTYALEDRSPWFVLAFAVACALGSVYGFMQGAWPFGIVEAVWSVIAVRRWRTRATS
jgi:hypothetical protein